MKILKVLFVLTIMFAAVLVPVYAQTAVDLTVTSNEEGFANLEWNDADSFGTDSDKYHIKYNKGADLSREHLDNQCLNSWVSFGSYYNLGGLDEGPHTFQVCLSRNGKDLPGTCSEPKTVYVQGEDSTDAVPSGGSGSSDLLVLTGSNNEPGFANMDWNDVNGLGDRFDKYNIKWNQGNVLKQNHANSWVSFGSYYNLGNLEEGPWTFQVCLSDNKNIVDNVCSNIETVYVTNYPVPYIENEIITAIPEVNEESPFALPENVVNPATDVECNNGCFYNDKCLPVGTRIRNGENKFCSWDGTMQPQITPGLTCQNDYECSTNSCLSGTCTDLSGQLQEQSNLLERILGWLTGRFR
ncbi:hypothetical protein HN799_03930 [Candidatus Woesearchaeota archaeon]|jgi:hypothetical protein|nr:hypothetical protein [Candidatus Woesearchaeota archaeon]MBT4247288.1 hypothetical protein [Candidatus Woesearchaeota archaeon]MBT7332398.1 hypothetical protein [Candidatus Woesearchaeota archaeon]